MNVERGEVLKRRTQCNNNYNRDDGVKGAQESFLQAELAIVGNIVPEAHLKDIDDNYDINVRVWATVMRQESQDTIAAVAKGVKAAACIGRYEN